MSSGMYALGRGSAALSAPAAPCALSVAAASALWAASSSSVAASRHSRCLRGCGYGVQHDMDQIGGVLDEH